jgi:hypothetical protein
MVITFIFIGIELGIIVWLLYKFKKYRIQTQQDLLEIKHSISRLSQNQIADKIEIDSKLNQQLEFLTDQTNFVSLMNSKRNIFYNSSNEY